MLTDLQALVPGIHFPPWSALAAGFGSTALAFVLGCVLLNRRRSPLPASGLRMAFNVTAPEVRIPLQSDPFLEGAASERRQAVRRTGKPIKVILSDAATQTECWEGWVVDRSLGGLCLSVPQPMPPGTRLKVRAEGGHRGIWVEVEVRHCRSLESRWALGCQFA